MSYRRYVLGMVTTITKWVTEVTR